MLDALELGETIKEYPDQIARMMACLSRLGRTCTDRGVALAWASYSDSLCAAWLMLPEDDDMLAQTLLEYLPSGGNEAMLRYQMTLVSCDDGTGDAFLEIPSRILRDLGWGVGDSLQIHAGDDGTLVLHHVP
ncbi:hypothetical protein AB4Y45_24570 [Paraburkholderia sp. EG287A]|uniref:hypothetical protein n=1 Tax=unclassified Paraburkholderia TaxID=2615204 RepID=UPI0034D2F9CB